MKFNYFKLITKSTLMLVMTLTSCNDDNDNEPSSPPSEVTKEAFVKNYAAIVAKNYNDSYASALEMQTKINEFIATPSASTLNNAQKAWLSARDYYGQTEAFREANGPIDNPDLLNTEGQINAWPLEEGFIDYVSGNRGQKVQNGIIGDTEFVLTEASILGKNEELQDGESEENEDNADNITTGWHAIEFLLWGQDLNYNSVTHMADDFSKSGERPFTDYTTEVNADRRKQYLQIVTDLLIKDLKDLNDTWADGGSYRNTFEALDEDIALTNILNGIGFISNGEVAAERLDPAIADGQENEHSCFSDNTKQDMWANVNGINNVINGIYTSKSGAKIQGVSLIDLVKNVDNEIADELKDKATTTLVKLNALLSASGNFDEIISKETEDSNGPAGQLSTALKDQGAAIADAAFKLGASISIN
ncbi:imelysin family protein [Wenyingzhuangia sp. IMCC45533]